MHRLRPSLCPEVQREEAHADAQGSHNSFLMNLHQLNIKPLRVMQQLSVLKVWPMGVASTVSRLPVTVKMVPVSANEEEDGGGGGGGTQHQQQGEQEQEEGPQQQQTNQTQAEEAAAQTGNGCAASS